MSENGDTASIYERMAAILSELPAIGKSQRNEQQGFMFRGHDDVLNALNPLLAHHQVFAVPSVLDRVTAQRQTSKGSVMFEVNLLVSYTFYGPAGDSVTASAWGEGTDMGDKATNKAMTMAFKNVLNQAFAISTAETVDSDSQTPEETVSRPAQARQGGSQNAGDGQVTDSHGFNESRGDNVPGDPVIHFSKNKGKRLSELNAKQLEWYATTWVPNPEYAKEEDYALKAAAERMHLGVPAGATFVAPDDLDVPF